MSKLFLSALTLFLAIITAGQSLSANRQNVEVIDEEEYAVYSAIVSRYEDVMNGKPPELLVIDEFTYATSKERCLPDNLLKSEYYVAMTPPEFVPDIARVVNDYKSKNEQSHRLSKSLKIRADYLFVNREETVASLKGGDPAWRQFYLKYPRSSGYITLSRVGFNSQRTRALVYIEIKCDWFCGDGTYIFLTKENGVWKEVFAPNCWVT